MKQKIKVDLITQLCVSSVFLVLGLKKIIPSSLVSFFFRSQLFVGTGNEVGNQNGVGAVSMNFSVCLPQFVTL